MKEKLFSVLTVLAARKHGSEEGNEKLSPFIKKTMTIEATFVSNERTFSSRYEKSYVDGQTILALLGKRKHEIAILIHPDGNWKEARKPVLPLKEGDRFEIEVEILGFNSLHQRVTFGEFIPEEMRSRQNGGAYGSRPDVTVKTQSIQPPVERPNRRRRKPEKSEESEEKKRMKSTSQEEKSENLGRGNLSAGLPQGNYLKWLIVFFCLSLVAFAVGFAIRLVANAFN